MRCSTVRRAAVLALTALSGLFPAAAQPSSPDLVRKHTAAGSAAAERLLPGLVDFGPGWTATKARAQDASLTCPTFHPRLPDVVEIGAAVSDDFRASPQGPFVSASSWVYGSGAQALTVWKSVVGPGVLRCFEHSVEHDAPGGVRFQVHSAARSPFPALAERTAAFRIVATAQVSGQSVTTNYTLIVLGHDRQLAELSFARLSAPVPRSTELMLARTVARRLG